MKKLSRASVIALGLFSLSSCALPPREAWRVIQHDGLFPYVSVELGKRPVPPYVILPPGTGSRFVTLTPRTQVPGSPRPGGDVYVRRPACALLPNRYLDDNLTPVAKSAPVVVAPKPASHPAPAAPAHQHPHPAVATAAPKAAPHPAPKARGAVPAPRPVVNAPVAKPAAPVVASVPAAPPAKPVTAEIAAAPKAKPAPAIAAEKPKVPASVPARPAKPDADGVISAKAVVPELPFGTPIPGRPGLVNSPYAGKYQIVDVTGLNPGQEVKCPYTGKLFRVPSVQQAKNAAKLGTEPPPAPAKKADGEKKP